MAIINKTGIGDGNLIEAEHITRIIDSLNGTGSYSIAATGSFTGSFKGDGSQLTGVPAGPSTTASYVDSSGVDGPLGMNSILSASFATTASFAVSASRSVSASFAVSASRAITAQSSNTASFVTTLNQDVRINGDLNIYNSTNGGFSLISLPTVTTSGSAITDVFGGFAFVAGAAGFYEVTVVARTGSGALFPPDPGSIAGKVTAFYVQSIYFSQTSSSFYDGGFTNPGTPNFGFRVAGPGTPSLRFYVQGLANETIDWDIFYTVG